MDDGLICWMEDWIHLGVCIYFGYSVPVLPAGYPEGDKAALRQWPSFEDQGETRAKHMHLEFIKVQKDSGILARSKRRTKINLEQFPPSIWRKEVDTGISEVWKSKKKKREKCGIVTREQSIWSDWPTDQNVINNEVEWLNNLLIVYYIYQILSPWSHH